jgi:hypothetical protein
VRAVREWAAQCHRVDTGLTAQCRTVEGMASSGGLAEQRRDMIPTRVRGTAWRGFVFDLGACVCQNIKSSGRGAGVGAASPREPRARWSLARGGVRPSSEAESRPRGRLALERGRIPPEGAFSPRVRRSLVSTALRPSSKTELRSRGAGVDCSGGMLRPPGSRAPATGT